MHVIARDVDGVNRTHVLDILCPRYFESNGMYEKI